MNEVLSGILSLLAGAVLGYIFFGGLWLTVRRLPHMKKPFLWTILSFFLRLGIALTGFYFVVRGGHWIRLLICLIGFMVVRYILAVPMRRQLDNAKNEEAG